MLKKILAGSAAATLALAPISAHAAPDAFARAGASMAEANSQVGEDETVIGIAFLLVVVTILIFASDGDEPVTPDPDPVSP